MKKRLLLLVTVVLLLTACIVSVSAADASGKCGDDLTWTARGNDLIITGTGPMYDYSEGEMRPWEQAGAYVTRVELTEGVTSIGAYAFANSSVGRVRIPASVRSIGKKAFAAERSLILWFLGPAPTLASDIASNTAISAYTVNWDSRLKKNYGGNINWVEAELSLSAAESNQLIGLNATLRPEDFSFKVYEIQGREYLNYTPGSVTFSAKDTSTYGQKNIKVTADGYTFDFTYFVTDGTNHLELIDVRFDELAHFNGYVNASKPVVTMGSMLLEEGTHYTVTRKRVLVGNDAKVTITGKGIAEGFEKTFYAPVLKQDLSEAKTLEARDTRFTGEPMDTIMSVRVDAQLTRNEDYYVLFKNNVNAGTATASVVGTGNYYGIASDDFQVAIENTQLAVTGSYVGQLDGELTDDVPIDQRIICPGKQTINVNTRDIHVAYYTLYRLEGETYVQEGEWMSEAGDWYDTSITIDFTSVYENYKAVGGVVYLLSATWVNTKSEVYAGAVVLLVPAKVLPATSMTMEKVENDGDFRKEYFNLTGDDGVLGAMTWESSDLSVAEVKDGVVTMKKPGSTVISGRSGNLLETWTLTVPQLYLTDGIIFDYSKEKGARVIYDSRVLTQGTDYVLSVREDSNGITVTATGCGLFTGELVKTFNGMDSLADPHTHSFDNGCDGTCNGCDFTRSNDHSYAETWGKNQTHHWHACTKCGHKKDMEAHTISAADDKLCQVCGVMYTPGDLNGDEKVNEDDAIYLLQYILLPEYFSISQDADYVRDNKVNEDDAIYLLQHVLLPEYFPLEEKN